MRKECLVDHFVQDGCPAPGAGSAAENVRQIPPGDPDFEILYRRHNGAEIINRHFDDTLWLRRAHSVGNRCQLLNMITYALGVNALSMHVRRRGLAPPQAA
jgi:hypothetical protein